MFFGNNYATHTVYGFGNNLARKLPNVLVAVWTKVSALVLVHAQIKFGSVLDNAFVYGRKQNVVVVVYRRNRDNQMPMVFTGIAPYQSTAAVSTGTVCAQQFFGERFF
jgi:hypothetical protein